MPRMKAADVAEPSDASEVVEKPSKKAEPASLFLKNLWDGEKSSLPEPVKDKKGNVVKNGAARFKLHRGIGRYELQAVSQGRCGIKTRMVKMLIDSAKRPRDRALIAQLKKAGAVID